MEGLEFDCIGDMERVWLKRKFERDGIFQVVRDCPDGFTMAFYHH